MKVETVIKQTTVLHLTWDEKEWLRNLMQNPINTTVDNVESAENTLMRERFFYALVSE